MKKTDHSSKNAAPWTEISKFVSANSESVKKCSELAENLIKVKDAIISNQQKYMQIREVCNQKKERIINLKKRIAGFRTAEMEKVDFISLEDEGNCVDTAEEKSNAIEPVKTGFKTAEADNVDLITLEDDGNGAEDTEKEESNATNPVENSGGFNWTPSI